MNFNTNIKIVVAGESLSGKTSLIKRFTQQSFQNSLTNEVRNLNRFSLEILKKNILVIWHRFQDA